MSESLYSCRPHVVACSSLGTSALATAVAAGEEADDDAAEADDGADDGLEDAADTADDSHDCISNGLEARSDLLKQFCQLMFLKIKLWLWRLTQDITPPILDDLCSVEF